MVETETLRVWSIPRRRRRILVLVWRHVSLALMIVVVSCILLRLARYSAGMASVWISNGLNIALVLCTNPRRRRELLYVTFFANLLGNYFSGETLLDSAAFGSANLIEVFIATLPFRKMAVQRINLADIRTLLKMGLYSAVAGAGCAAAFISLWISFSKGHRVTGDFIISWYCSDALGAIILIPLYWAWRRKPTVEHVPLFKHDSLAALVLFTAVVAGVFWQTSYPFLFLAFPVLMPVLYTSAFAGASRAILITTVIGVVATACGHGPLLLVHASLEGRILILQLFLLVSLVTAFPFAALLMEREKLVSTLKLSEARYRDLARLDGLTLLPNRREFDSFLDISRQRAVRQNTPLSLLLIDIDHFKKLNDQHGHTVGDEYLRKMAVAIASAVPRKTDLVARYGGEEFAVVLDSCDDPGAIMVAERIKAAAARLSQSLVAHNRPPVTISIGVATTLPQLRSSSKTLIDAADQGLYAAKRNGRDRIERGTNLIAQAEAMAI
jgi:diguanylate cyclase (GGDEF)-like protein